MGNTPPREKILADGKALIRVKRSGIIQLQEFLLVREKSPFGVYAYLVLDKFMDLSESLRVAEEVQLPIKTLNGTTFPKGKGTKDFVGL